MTALDDLVAVLGRYDDAAWAALANKGLLRRATKDLETLEVSVLSADPVAVQVGEHRVEIGPGGPAHARCSCPASTVCQHVLTAGLWLVANLDEAGDEESLHDELMAVDEAQLVAFGGRAAARWAHQFVADLDMTEVAVESGRQVQITFRSPRVIFRFMGGGLEGLVPDVRLPSAEKYAAAAVVAYQCAHGVDPAPVEPVRRRETATRRAQTGSRTRLLVATSNLLLDTVRLGASHLSPAVHQRYQTTAVWAQGAELHRLALMLRRLADHVELLLDRNVRADEHALLDEAATAFALVAALRAVGEPPPARLAGRARATYDAVRSMELVGLGAVPWRAPSGYQGLTCLFWWIEGRRFVSWTDARPESMWSFDPRARYTQLGPWSGLQSPAATAGRTIRLTRAELSAGGRLSGVERTHAAVGPVLGSPWADMPVVETWASLEERVRGRTGLLDEPEPLRDWVLLKPSSVRPAVFDPIRQVLWWTLVDDTGAALPLSLRWTALASAAVQRLESLTPAEFPEGGSVVARMSVRRGQLTGEPLSIVRADGSVDVLHFDTGTGLAPAGERRLTELPEDDGDEAMPLPAALHGLRSWVLRQMERGTASATPAQMLAELQRQHRAARGVGFTVFPDVAELDDPTEALLRSHFVGLQVADLLA